MKSTRRVVFTVFSIVIIPVLLLIFVAIYKIDRSVYMRLTVEDGVVEWLTAVCLLCAGIISARLAFKMHKTSGPHVWFFVAFAICCILFALEEMSWGQRIFGIKSPEYFLEHSDQQEINVHNVLQKRFGFKTKNVASQVLFYYGTVLPILALDGRIRKWIAKVKLVVPPVCLALGFLIGALLMADKPTGREEELGELFFSLCFVLFVIWQYVDSSKQETR